MNSEKLGDVKNSCESLKNCTELKTEICIALQRNLKTVKPELEKLQEELDLLRENWTGKRKKYLTSLKKLNLIELFQKTLEV